MADKPKLAITWLGACGGCDQAIVDLNEALLRLAGQVDIVLWPLAMDFKIDSLRALPDQAITLCILHGCVRNSEHLEMARLLREKSQLVLAFGSCACFGGTPALANFRGRRDILDWVYRDAPTVVNLSDTLPRARVKVNEGHLSLPEFFDQVYPLNQVIEIDYSLPGCPPPVDLVGSALQSILAGKLPPKGYTLAPQKALCDLCSRNRSKPYRMEIAEIRRIHEIEVDADTCFLAKGILCLGPATRAGCGQSCLQTNTPCRGCFGPVAGVEDSGSRFLSALATLLQTENFDDIQRVIDSLDDPAGYLYRFTQPCSILGRQPLQEPAHDPEDHD
ncbi:oxidoreductase [Trichloromonas sp.]|uniref:NADH-quinone oxidoreductase subunit B family protein n=1 Tax=Trichloromonas sp. TaxID=3069249 RepID=UPI003D81BA56